VKSWHLLPTALVLAALAATGCGSQPGIAGARVAGLNASYGASARGALRAEPAGYYAGAENLQGGPLLAALAKIVTKHKDLGYDGAREVMFKDVDDLDNDNVVTCIYLGRTIANVTGTKAAFQNGQGLNAEHTWPQSKGAVGAGKADLHHLFPADCKANSTRGSFPFGTVVGADWADGGSKRGKNAEGVEVFEPRDQQKGDTARALLYFYTVYGKLSSTNLGNFKVEEATLHRWNQLDPVDATERLRNDAIQAAQGNRNPFVDHPEWVEKVGNFLGGAAR
jgi:endonuclease I